MPINSERIPELQNNEEHPEEGADLTYRQTVAAAVKYLVGETEEGRDFFIKKIKETEAGQYFVLGIEESDDYYAICYKIVSFYLERQNMAIDISNTPAGQAFTEEGRLLLENKNVKIQVNDEKNLVETNQNIKNLIEIIKEEAERFIANDLFKCVIVVDDESLSIRMDPGSHKEFLGALLSNDEKIPHALFYKHIPSGYEKTNKESNRATYIQQITSGQINEKTKDVSKFLLIFERDKFQQEFRKYFRLCQSVKNLDFNTTLRKEDVRFAVDMFNEGVVNMQGFLTICDSCASHEQYLNFKKRGKILDNSEEAILENYFSAFVERKKHIKDQLQFLRQAKKLNFEIAEDFVELRDRSLAILSISEQSPKTAQDFIKFYKEIAGKLLAMQDLVKQSLGVYSLSSSVCEIDVEKLINKLFPKIEQIAQIARFGYGSPDVLYTTEGGNNVVDVSELGKKRVPEMAWRAYEESTKLLQGKKSDELRKWSDVESLEEALRFLHILIVEAPVLVGQNMDRDLIESKFYRNPKEIFQPLRIIDVTSDKLDNCGLAQVIINELKGLSKYRFKEVVGEKSYGRQPLAIFSDDYFEFSLPTVKHYIEMSAQSYDEEKRKEYTIALRYLESGYDGFAQRQDFTKTVLERLGFMVERERVKRGNLQAHFRTEDKQNWQRSLQHTVRLCFALKDLDLEMIEDDTVDLFEEGVINGFHWFRDIKDALKTGKMSEWTSRYVKVIMKQGSDSEKKLLANLLFTKAKLSKKLLKLFTSELNENELSELKKFSTVGLRR
ncbi:MAG: hypothetical protein AAB723_04175 [Patescibacteria group bacterium]